MKRTKFLLITLLAAIPLLGWAITARAQKFESGDNITIAANKTLNSTLFASGRTIDIAGTVRGDVICAGQTVTITGNITGDVICAGQSIRVSGTVEGDVRLAGQNVTLGGTVSHNASIATQSFTTEGNSHVEGDVSVASSDAVLNGQVERDMAVTAGTLTVNGQVGRNIQANVEHLRLGNDAKVAGTVEYTSPRNLTRDQGAVIAGQTTRHEPTRHEKQIDHIAPALALFCFVSLLLTGLVLVLLLPRIFHAASQLAIASLGKTFLIGFLASLIVPALIGILIFTIIGLPLAVLVLLAWLLVLLLSGPFAAYLLGRLILRGRNDNAIWAMLLGSVILLLLYLVPVLNILVMLVAIWFGIGMILQLGVFQRPRYTFAHATDSPDTRRETIAASNHNRKPLPRTKQ